MPELIINKLLLKSDKNTLVDLIQDSSPIILNHSVALVGESGSGKSLTLKTILNMAPKELKVTFRYQCDFELNHKNIGFIPQNPFTSLSPITKITKQFFCDEEKIDDLLTMVKLNLNVKNKFPLELSGGQLQRVVIAIALSKNPKILLLDEPTTALDEDSKKAVLDIITNLQKKMDFVILFVSHDIESVQNICKDIIILQNGKICEMGKLQKILQEPKENYTKQLISSNFKNRKFRT